MNKKFKHASIIQTKKIKFLAVLLSPIELCLTVVTYCNFCKKIKTHITQ